jgi:hypothetical protein
MITWIFHWIFLAVGDPDSSIPILTEMGKSRIPKTPWSTRFLQPADSIHFFFYSSYLQTYLQELKKVRREVSYLHLSSSSTAVMATVWVDNEERALWGQLQRGPESVVNQGFNF